MSAAKQPFLVVYDYGTGGIWLVIKANTVDAIRTIYPGLTIFADKPDWMSEQDKIKLLDECRTAGFWWDIDDAPTGWLKDFADAAKNA